MVKLRAGLYVALLLTAVVTYFTSTSLKTVGAFLPVEFTDPVMTPVKTTNSFEFVRDGYRYRCDPLFEYSISGLVVHQLDYSWFSIDHSERAFPVDLCLIWGENLARKVYLENTVNFSQDCRFCFVEWGANVSFRIDQLSNNHLVVSDPAMERKIKRVRASDQVTLHGRLVNVHGQLLGEGGRYDSEYFDWNTSTHQSDTGPGACKVIYVDAVTVLRQGNPVSRWLFRGSLWGLGLMTLWGTVKLFLP
jgi:hypothetical protein